MRALHLAFALVVAALVLTHAATLPDYRAHRWQCATDAECAAEELAVFGTVDGSNPFWTE